MVTRFSEHGQKMQMHYYLPYYQSSMYIIYHAYSIRIMWNAMFQVMAVWLENKTKIRGGDLGILWICKCLHVEVVDKVVFNIAYR